MQQIYAPYFLNPPKDYNNEVSVGCTSTFIEPPGGTESEDKKYVDNENVDPEWSSEKDDDSFVDGVCGNTTAYRNENSEEDLVFIKY